MTSSNMQEAREILDKEFGIKCGLGGYQRKVRAIALALSSAEARGRLAGLEEGAKEAEKWIQPVEPGEWVPAGECGTADHNATPINIAKAIRQRSSHE